MTMAKNCKTLELRDFENCRMPPQFLMTKERIEHFKVKNEDVWVTSFPKSGTTWIQEMVWLLANDLDYEGAKVDLNFRFPFIEFNCLIKSEIEFCKKNNITYPFIKAVLPDMIEVLNETPGRRFIKTHLPWNLLPRQITNGIKTPKIVHVIRDPKQVAVSFYHHNSSIFKYFIGDLDVFIDLYINGEILQGGYFHTVLSYWKQCHLPNVLFVTYEEMHSDLKGVIKRVSEFLRKSYSEQEMDKLVQHLSFDQMKTNSAVNKQTRVFDKDISFMRKGKTDSYKSELSEEMIGKLDKWIKENVRGTGLPYEFS